VPLSKRCICRISISISRRSRFSGGSRTKVHIPDALARRTWWPALILPAAGRKCDQTCVAHSETPGHASNDQRTGRNGDNLILHGCRMMAIPRPVDLDDGPLRAAALGLWRNVARPARNPHLATKAACRRTVRWKEAILPQPNLPLMLDNANDRRIRTQTTDNAELSTMNRWRSNACNCSARQPDIRPDRVPPAMAKRRLAPFTEQLKHRPLLLDNRPARKDGLDVARPLFRHRPMPRADHICYRLLTALRSRPLMSQQSTMC